MRIERILQVAEQLIVEHGFARLSVREIAKIAHVNIATVYQYFPSSLAILRMLADRHIERMQEMAVVGLSEIAMLESAEQKVDRLSDLTFNLYSPAYIAVWRGMLSDNALIAKDISDTRFAAAGLSMIIQHINPNLAVRAPALSMLVIVMGAESARLIHDLDESERPALLEEKKRILRSILLD
jgi:AcrR family transcriptional regulator